MAAQAPVPAHPATTTSAWASHVSGGHDFAARLLVRGLAERPGWQFVVDNRPTIVAPEVVMRAAPDGYTLLVSGGTFVTGPLINKMPYEPLADFAPISLTHRQTNVLVVHPSLSVKSVKDLIALARARPGQLNYASSGTGSASHLSGELTAWMKAEIARTSRLVKEGGIRGE